MEEPASFGATVRDRRLALGYSLGQLATKVRKTAASIRAWERGANEPDAEELAALAEALDLDSAVLSDLLAAAAQPEPPQPVVAPPRVASREVVEPGESVPAKAAAGPRSESDSAAEVRPEPAAATDPDPVVVTTDDIIDDASVLAAAAAAAATAVDKPAPIHEAMTEAVPVIPTGSVAVAASTAQPDVGVEGVRPRPFSFGEGENPILQTWDAMFDWYGRVFDPEREWIYRVRVVLLIIGLFVMLRVLGWALGHLWDALGEVLDSISFSPSETPDVAN